jgi:hypothetical protein
MRIDRAKPKYSKKSCPSATFSTTNLALLDVGSNPGSRGGKSATNRLRYGTVCTLLRQLVGDNEDTTFIRVEYIDGAKNVVLENSA